MYDTQCLNQPAADIHLKGFIPFEYLHIFFLLFYHRDTKAQQ